MKNRGRIGGRDHHLHACNLRRRPDRAGPRATAQGIT